MLISKSLKDFADRTKRSLKPFHERPVNPDDHLTNLYKMDAVKKISFLFILKHIQTKKSTHIKCKIAIEIFQ